MTPAALPMTEATGLPGSSACQPGVEPLVADVIQDVIAALDVELQAMVDAGSGGVELTDGRPVGSIGPDRLWSFELDGELPVGPDSPAALAVPGQDPVPATILAVADTDVVVGVREELGEAIDVAELRTEPWFIYRSLRARLAAALQDPDADDAMLAALLDMHAIDAHDGAVAGEQDPSRSQEDAAGRASQPGLHFVWGPPGTGKTTSLARTVSALARRHRRVIVLAHANAAVDVALVRLAEELQDDPLLRDGKILRVGTPQLPAALARDDILPDSIVTRADPELGARRADLHRQRRALSRTLQRASVAEQHEATLALQLVRDELRDIERRFAEARAQLIRRATVVGCTLARFVVDDLLWAWFADAIVVDEASMAGLPFVIAAALRSPETLSIFGDFRQLPPIAIAREGTAQRWFARDVFEESGIVEGVERDFPDVRLSMLRMNYRMAPPIGRVVSDFAYFGLLETHEDVAHRTDRVAAAPPFPGVALALVDLAGMTTCLTDRAAGSFSRFNLLAAAVVRSVVEGVDPETTVGVISPYRAQTKLHVASLRGLANVVAATTHRFQGSERDVIVLDITDAAPQEGPSRLTGRQADLALRLLNVGASRAVGKLIVCADLEFLAAEFATDAPIRTLVELMKGQGAPVVRMTELLDARSTSGAVRWWPDWRSAAGPLATEIATSSAVDISLPGTGWIDEAISGALRRLPASPHAVVRTSIDAVDQLEDLAVRLRLRTLGPSPVAIVDARTIWIGSQRPDGPVARMDGERLAAVVRRSLIPAE